MNKTKFLFSLAAVATVLVFCFFLFLIFKNYSKSNSQVNSSQGLLPKNKGADPGVSAPSTLSEEELNKRSFLVSGLIDKLPYTGKNFSLSYDFSSAKFILYINPASQQEGDSEFNQFIKQNGVNDRSWIENLFVSSISPTPQP